jgi:hypothetical protein
MLEDRVDHRDVTGRAHRQVRPALWCTGRERCGTRRHCHKVSDDQEITGRLPW